MTYCQAFQAWDLLSYARSYIQPSLHSCKIPLVTRIRSQDVGGICIGVAAEDIPLYKPWTDQSLANRSGTCAWSPSCYLAFVCVSCFGCVSRVFVQPWYFFFAAVLPQQVTSVSCVARQVLQLLQYANQRGAACIRS
jgi:hypothetical protein